MKRYTITVNGNAYDVTVDEADGSVAPVAAPAPKKAAPALSRGVFRKQRILTGGRFARDELSGVLIELPDCIISVLKYHSKISA